MDFSDQKNPAAAGNPRLQTAASLRRAGRCPPVPFTVQLTDEQSVTVVRLLRVLPGKRITGEGVLNGDKILVKLFIAGRGVRHARRESRGIAALEQAGLPTPRLKLCRSLTGGGYALISEFLEPSSPLPADEPGPALRLLGRLHRAGLTHTDLHSGNFLQHNGTLYLIDGDAVRKCSRTRAAKQAVRDIATLIALTPDPACEELLTFYSDGNPDFHPPPQQIRKEVTRIRSKGIDRLLKKSVRDSSAFCVSRRFFRFTSVVRTQAEALAGLISDPDRAVDNGLRLKTGGSSTVACIERPGQTLVIKRYNLKNPGHAFSRLWRPSRAWRSWMTALRLQQIGTATPDPLALIEERFGPLRRRAWLITEFCPGKLLSDHLDENREPPPAEAAALTGFFKTLYRRRISHGDLKATNLFWHDGRIFMIDLDAAKQHRFAFTHRRAWRKDRARLLRNWPGESPLCRWLDARLPD
jgi:tRNA A-37 threonylcarbamoyl transferase component Bud32